MELLRLKALELKGEALQSFRTQLLNDEAGPWGCIVKRQPSTVPKKREFNLKRRGGPVQDVDSIEVCEVCSSAPSADLTLWFLDVIRGLGEV